MIVQSISGPYLDAHSDTTTHAMAAIRICFWITLPCTPPDYAYPIHSPNRWTQTINPMHALLHPALCHEASSGADLAAVSPVPIPGADVGQGELIRGWDKSVVSDSVVRVKDDVWDGIPSGMVSHTARGRCERGARTQAWHTSAAADAATMLHAVATMLHAVAITFACRVPTQAWRKCCFRRCSAACPRIASLRLQAPARVQH